MKFRYLVVFAALAFMASCSKQDGSQVAGGDDAWKYDESLPVPVNLSAPQIFVESDLEPKSKAMITTNHVRGLDIGIMGLNRDGGDWGMEVNDDVLICNSKAVANSQNNFEFKGAEDATVSIYYPMTSNVNFNFYGYYPYDDAVQYTDSHYEVTYENIGDIDILWAKATATQINDGQNTYEGFNARYVRKAEDINKPSLEFNHLLTALSFRVASADGENHANDITFTGVSLTGMDRNVTLKIASIDGSAENEGVLVTAGNPGTIPVINTSSQTPQDSLFSIGVASGNNVGNLMVMPSNTYTANVYVTSKDGQSTVIPVTISREAPGFEKGKRYTVNLLIANPEEVIISSELTEWGDGGSMDVPVGD